MNTPVATRGGAPVAPVRLADLADLGRVIGDGKILISGVRHDSRAVLPGEAFVAVRGEKVDGSGYAHESIERGASVVVVEQPLEGPPAQLIVKNSRKALPLVAHRVYGHPTRSLRVVGITGTNGKTTTAHLIEHMLSHCGERPALLGTVAFRGPDLDEAARHTTPEADVIARLARRTLDGGASHLVMEVSSHALSLHRADGIDYDVACFTNLSRDHLDFHSNLAAYGEAKSRLFTELRPNASVILVRDDFSRALADRIEASKRSVMRCAVDPSIGLAGPAIQVVSSECTRDGITAMVRTPGGIATLRSPLLGQHNLENLMVSLGAGVSLGLSTDQAMQGLAGASGAPGRLERVADPRDVMVLVDYAHTPEALSSVLDALRALTPGRLICVFGCGGDRDRGKRPLMGRAVAQRSDLSVLTSDNPRTEMPKAILADVEPGLREVSGATVGRSFLVESDRARAIRLALEAATAGDTVLIAGKGHEAYQIVGTERVPFDDRTEARCAIDAITGAD